MAKSTHIVTGLSACFFLSGIYKSIPDHYHDLHTQGGGPPTWTEPHFTSKTYTECPLPDLKWQLLHGPLRDSLSIKSLRYFMSDDKHQVIVLCSTGENICGHQGYIHGGYSAALLDNVLGTVAFWNLKMPATISLLIKYRKPLYPNDILLIKASKAQVDANQEGCIKLKGEIYTERHAKASVTAEAIFVDVSDKWASAS